MSTNSAPGYKKHPGHRITAEPAGVRVRVTFKGEVIADTREAIQMEEAMEGSTVAPAVYYIPRKDVRMEPYDVLPVQGPCLLLLTGRWTRECGLELRAAVRRDDGNQGSARVLPRQGRLDRHLP